MAPMHGLKVTLVGVGLLGGSLGLALKQRRLADHVWGYVRRPASVGECLQAGAVDHATTDLIEAVTGADVVVMCTPIGQMMDLTQRLIPALKPGALVTDVGSVKQPVVEMLEPVIHSAGGVFIGSHPMAGAERMGVSAARSDLFQGAVCVVTPSRQSPEPALVQLRALWTGVGGRVLTLSPEVHDAQVSRSSHLPHIVASQLANCVLSPEHPKEQSLLCASGFRDTTRIASGSPEMWHDIVMANRKNLIGTLGGFIAQLSQFRAALEAQDSAFVAEFFTRAKQRRDAWSEQGSSPE